MVCNQNDGGNDGVTNHCPPLLPSRLILSDPFSLLFLLFPTIDLATYKQNGLGLTPSGTSTYFIDFPGTAPRIEGNGRTGARVDPFTDQKHPVPPQCSHIGKLKSRKRRGLSQNHTTSIRDSDALILSVLCFFCEVF